VIGSVEKQFGAMYLEQFLPNISGESGVSVRDNRIRHEMNLEDIIHEYLIHCGSCEWMLKIKKNECIWRDDQQPP
jgi:hypothetical protein